jgi:hypothetical protein
MDPFQNGAQATDPAPSRDSEIAKEWISLAAEFFTAPAAAVFGFLTGGPAGAGVGAAVGTLVSHGLRAAGLEVWERQMSKREKVRVAAVITMAGEEMQKRLAAGEKLRQDDFFEAQPPHHSHAMEVTESLLLKAQREPEERKLRYIANLIALRCIRFSDRRCDGASNAAIRFRDELPPILYSGLSAACVVVRPI